MNWKYLKKDAYSYEWVDSYEKFKYTELPPKKCFHSSIKDDKRDNDNGYISDDQYLRDVWNTFSFNTFEKQSLFKKRFIIFRRYL